jgi:glyoxylase-like metal-dependent hydrolase (beta-lactamase superfamily II)
VPDPSSATFANVSKWPEFEGEEVRPGLHWLQIADHSIWVTFGAHVYVIGGRDEVVIVDTAFAQPAPHTFIAGYLAGLGNPRVKAILLTHHDTDHSGGAARLRALTGAPIWCHPLEAPLVPEATAVPAAEGVEAIPGAEVDGELADGQLLTVGGVALQVVHTPGHSPGHCCFWLPQQAAMLTGDLVLGGATTSAGGTNGEMALLERSLERLLEFPMQLIGPAHGPLIDDPIANVRGILAHRRERELQVLAALKAGHVDPPSIVQAIYRDLEERTVKVAVGQVGAILSKLERDGMVRHKGDGEERRWFPLRRIRRTPPRGAGLRYGA